MHTHMRADAVEQVSGHSEGVARQPQGSTDMQRTNWRDERINAGRVLM